MAEGTRPQETAPFSRGFPPLLSSGRGAHHSLDFRFSDLPIFHGQATLNSLFVLFDLERILPRFPFPLYM